MKIKTIEIYGYKLSYAHGKYVMSGNRAATHQDSTLVRIIAEDGTEGCGETATLPGTYLPTFCGSTRAARTGTASDRQGPANVTMIGRLMTSVLMGYDNAKSAIDIARRDLFRKSVNLPVAALLGGLQQEAFPLYEAVPLASPEEMSQYVISRGDAGIRRFQLKVVTTLMTMAPQCERRSSNAIKGAARAF